MDSPERARIKNSPEAIRSMWHCAFSGAFIFGLDRATKAWATSALNDRVIDLFGPFTLALVYNKGVAFGMGSSAAPVLVAIAFFALVAYQKGVAARLTLIGSIGIGLMIGGAISNIFDRLFGPIPGAVIDFIDLGYWPVFNFADVGVVVGAVLLSIWTWRNSQ